MKPTTSPTHRRCRFRSERRARYTPHPRGRAAMRRSTPRFWAKNAVCGLDPRSITKPRRPTTRPNGQAPVTVARPRGGPRRPRSDGSAGGKDRPGAMRRHRPTRRQNFPFAAAKPNPNRVSVDLATAEFKGERNGLRRSRGLAPDLLNPDRDSPIKGKADAASRLSHHRPDGRRPDLYGPHLALTDRAGVAGPRLQPDHAGEIRERRP